MSDRIVIVEGVRDRAFLAEQFENRLGWARDLPAKKEYRYVRGADRLRLVDGGGATVPAIADREIEAARTQPTPRIVVVQDSDDPVSVATPEAARRQSFAARMTKLGGTPRGADFEFADRNCVVSLVVWNETLTPASTDGVPDIQTLERIVCGALAAAHPPRGPVVQSYLASPPIAPTDPKAFMWSYMAKWWGKESCDEFLHVIWRDAAVAAELDKRLDAIGAKALFASL